MDLGVKPLAYLFNILSCSSTSDLTGLSVSVSILSLFFLHIHT